jgi:hypothetical protein
VNAICVHYGRRGPSNVLDVQATATSKIPTNVMPPYQLQDLAQHIARILSEREDPAQLQRTEDTLSYEFLVMTIWNIM